VRERKKEMSKLASDAEAIGFLKSTLGGSLSSRLLGERRLAEKQTPCFQEEPND
jgi:hypothetical protein